MGRMPPRCSSASQAKSSGSTTRAAPAFFSRRTAWATLRRTTSSGVRGPRAIWAQKNRAWSTCFSTMVTAAPCPGAFQRIIPNIQKSPPPSWYGGGDEIMRCRRGYSR